MTNKKFKKAAMALALTACVAATPLAANAETPENAAGAQAPAAVDHAEADTQEPRKPNCLQRKSRRLSPLQRLLRSLPLRKHPPSQWNCPPQRKLPRKRRKPLWRSPPLRTL